MKRTKTAAYILVVVVSCLLFAQTAAAQVSLYFTPSDLFSESDSYREGQRIFVRVQMDTGEAIVGVAEGIISFPSEFLSVQNVSKEESIFDLWVQDPAVSGNTISFVGGVLGGFKGTGTVFTVEFETKTDDTAKVFFDKARVLSFAAQPQNILESTVEGWYPFEIPTAIPDSFLFTKDLIEGDRNIEIAYLQLVLKAENLYIDDITGIFDAQTRITVQAFQEKYAEDILELAGLEQGTGIVGNLTRAKLNDLLPLKGPALFDIIVEPTVLKEPSQGIAFFLWISGAFILFLVTLVIWNVRRRRKKQQTET